MLMGLHVQDDSELLEVACSTMYRTIRVRYMRHNDLGRDRAGAMGTERIVVAGKNGGEMFSRS